jgi:hypothetical protein
MIGLQASGSASRPGGCVTLDATDGNHRKLRVFEQANRLPIQVYRATVAFPVEARRASGAQRFGSLERW